MSAAPPGSNKRSLLSRILCCVAPETDRETETANRPISRSEEKQAGQPSASTPNTNTTAREIPQATNFNSEKLEPTGVTVLTPSHDTNLVPNVTESDPIDVGVSSRLPDTVEIQPALERDVAKTTDIAPSTTLTPQLATRAEDKAALRDDEPLTPSSAAITATIPVQEIESDLPISQPVQGGSWLLPSLSPELKGKKCLVLDLDETLVHSSFKVIHQADFVVPVEIDGIYHNVYVIKRPGVDDFMQEVGRHFEIVIFTASLSKYADPVLDILDIHRVVHHRLFRESCHNHMGNYVKDLSQLGRDLKDAIIIDNSPASYVFHPAHAVPISSWFNDIHDTELTDLIPFLMDLTTVDDVSQVLELSL